MRDPRDYLLLKCSQLNQKIIHRKSENIEIIMGDSMNGIYPFRPTFIIVIT